MKKKLKEFKRKKLGDRFSDSEDAIPQEVSLNLESDRDEDFLTILGITTSKEERNKSKVTESDESVGKSESDSQDSESDPEWYLDTTLTLPQVRKKVIKEKMAMVKKMIKDGNIGAVKFGAGIKKRRYHDGNDLVTMLTCSQAKSRTKESEQSVSRLLQQNSALVSDQSQIRAQEQDSVSLFSDPSQTRTQERNSVSLFSGQSQPRTQERDSVSLISSQSQVRTLEQDSVSLFSDQLSIRTKKSYKSGSRAKSVLGQSGTDIPDNRLQSDIDSDIAALSIDDRTVISESMFEEEAPTALPFLSSCLPTPYDKHVKSQDYTSNRSQGASDLDISSVIPGSFQLQGTQAETSPHRIRHSSDSSSVFSSISKRVQKRMTKARTSFITPRPDSKLQRTPKKSREKDEITRTMHLTNSELNIADETSNVIQNLHSESQFSEYLADNNMSSTPKKSHLTTKSVKLKKKAYIPGF